jgi:putative oxidoreductase
MDPNASTAANQSRMEIGTDAPAGDPTQATANQPTRRQATGLPPGAPIPPASGASGQSTSGSRQHSGPPRTKLALLTWVGAYAVILVVLAVGGPALASWPLALRALVVSGLMVAAMTWVIVPVMTWLFRGWLARSPSAAHDARVGEGVRNPDRRDVVAVGRGAAAVHSRQRDSHLEAEQMPDGVTPMGGLRGDRAVNRSLWGLQIVLGVYFILVGIVHFIVPSGLPGLLTWMYDLSDALHVISGTADILGGLGLILPGLSRIRPGLTVWAAAGLLIVMIAAAPWHLGRGEVVNVVINLAVVGLLGFLAYGRVRRSPLPGSFGAPAT